MKNEILKNLKYTITRPRYCNCESCIEVWREQMVSEVKQLETIFADQDAKQNELRDDIDALLAEGRDAIYEVQNSMKDAARALDDVLYELEAAG